MRSVCERPAIWLFVAASVGITALAFFVDEPLLSWFIGLVDGQAYLAAAFAVAGTSRVLLRAAALVGAILAETWLLARADQGPWPTYFAAVACYQFLALVGVALAAAGWAAWSFRRGRSRPTLRYSLRELLAWMALVAVAAAAAQQADFPGVIAVMRDMATRSRQWWLLLLPPACGFACAAAMFVSSRVRLSWIVAACLVPAVWLLDLLLATWGELVQVDLGASRATVWYCALFVLCALVDRPRGEPRARS